jgi:precorrin-6B methylase 2
MFQTGDDMTTAKPIPAAPSGPVLAAPPRALLDPPDGSRNGTSCPQSGTADTRSLQCAATSVGAQVNIPSKPVADAAVRAAPEDGAPESVRPRIGPQNHDPLVSLTALAQSRYQSVIDVGCGEGERGVVVARKADRYLGLDCSPRAVRTARLRLTGLRNARARECLVPYRWPRRPADLILLSGVVGRFTLSDLQMLCNRIHASLMSGGEVVMICQSDDTATQLAARRAADQLDVGLRARGGYRCRSRQRCLKGHDLTIWVRDVQ